MTRVSVPKRDDLQDAANMIAIIVSWTAGFEIEWITLGEGADEDEWSVCPMPPNFWNFRAFDYRLKAN